MCAACCNILQYFLGGFGFAGSRFSRNQHALISELATHRPVRRVTNCKSLKQKNIFVHEYIKSFLFLKISLNWLQDFPLQFFNNHIFTSRHYNSNMPVLHYSMQASNFLVFVFNFTANLQHSFYSYNFGTVKPLWAIICLSQQKIWYCVPLTSIKFASPFKMGGHLPFTAKLKLETAQSRFSCSNWPFL